MLLILGKFKQKLEFYHDFSPWQFVFDRFRERTKQPKSRHETIYPNQNRTHFYKYSGKE